MNSPYAIWRSKSAVKRATVILLLTAIAGFVLYIAVRAISSSFDNADFPESLAVKVELMPVIFPVHMVTGALALLLLPVVYSLRHRPYWHRLLGRITAAVILISGVTAFPVALIAPVTLWSAGGFTAQAATWLILLALGIYNIRQRRVAAHRACMLLMAATTSGAVFFRVFLAFWAQYGSLRYFEAFYAFDAWVAWMLPLALCALFLRSDWRHAV